MRVRVSGTGWTRKEFLSRLRCAGHDSRMLCGQTTLNPRLKDIPVRIPQPQPDVPISIYEIQKGLKSRHFDTAKE